MKRAEFAHAVRAAGALLHEDVVLVVGSQALWGWVGDDIETLPEPAARSREADIASLDDPDEWKSHLLSGALGEESMFDQTFGYFVDGVSATTPQAPPGWLDRCRPVSWPTMSGVTALCIEPHDLVIAKLVAGRDKDFAFADGVLAAGLIDLETLAERARAMPLPPEHASVLDSRLEWLTGLAAAGGYDVPDSARERGR